MELKFPKDELFVCGTPKDSTFTYVNKEMFNNYQGRVWGDNNAHTVDSVKNHDWGYYYYYPRMGNLKQSGKNGDKYLPKIKRNSNKSINFEFRLRPANEYHSEWYGKDNQGNVFKPKSKNEGHLEYRIQGDPVTRVKSKKYDYNDPDSGPNGILTE